MLQFERFVSFFKVRRYYLYFSLFCAIFFCLMTFVEHRNGKFWTNDLLVYFGASEDFFNGKSPYVHPYGLGSGFFKYTPPTLYFFWPFHWCSFLVIQVFHVITSFFSFVAIIILLHRSTFFNKSSESHLPRRLWVLWLSFLFVVIHLVREIHLGNINLQLLLLICLGIIFFKSGKYKFAGIYWTLVVFFKPFFLVLALPLILKHVKFLLICLGITAFMLVFPIVFQPLDAYIELWKQWTLAVIHHSDYQVNYDAVSSLVTHYTGYVSNWIPSIVMLLVVGIGILLDQLRMKRLTELDWVVVLLALTPNFFKTDTQHFMYSLPLFYLLMNELITKKKLILWLAFGFLMAVFSFNSNDLLGSQLGHWVSENGFLGLSNLGLVILFIGSRYFYIVQSHDAGKEEVC
jgi:hypothetical protein